MVPISNAGIAFTFLMIKKTTTAGTKNKIGETKYLASIAFIIAPTPSLDSFVSIVNPRIKNITKVIKIEGIVVNDI